MRKTLTSPQNKTVKRLIQLQNKSRNRRKEGRFVIEGLQEIELALKADYNVEQLYYYPELANPAALKPYESQITEWVEISKTVYKKVAYRSSTEGILALAQSKTHAIDTLNLSQKKPFVLVAEAPEKPGNIGALLRTADAANADAVFIANPKTDLYNPNIIRSSVGCVFTNPIATGKSSEIIAFLREKNITIYCAALQASESYIKCDYTPSTAIVVGTEAEGLTQEWLENSTKTIRIPMQGEIDSMNVSVSAGILMFEVRRQRGFS